MSSPLSPCVANSALYGLGESAGSAWGAATVEARTGVVEASTVVEGAAVGTAAPVWGETNAVGVSSAGSALGRAGGLTLGAGRAVGLFACVSEACELLVASAVF